MKQSTRNAPRELPESGPLKQNAKELDHMLDDALEDSMAASDPPAVTQPDVKKKQNGFDHFSNNRSETSGKQVGNKI